MTRWLWLWGFLSLPLWAAEPLNPAEHELGKPPGVAVIQGERLLPLLSSFAPIADSYYPQVMAPGQPLLEPLRLAYDCDGRRWWLRIEAVGGGVRPRLNLAADRVPETGWWPHLEFSGEVGVQPMPAQLKELFFFTREGENRGWMQLEIIPPTRESNTISLRYLGRVNTLGRSNL